jgi:hypothetical protein
MSLGLQQSAVQRKPCRNAFASTVMIVFLKHTLTMYVLVGMLARVYCQNTMRTEPVWQSGCVWRDAKSRLGLAEMGART